MIQHLKPYPAYKDSGVPWLGQVPEHWEVRRLASCLRTLESGSREQIDMDAENGIPNLGGEHIGRDGQLLLRNMRYISRRYFQSLRKGVVKENDVLLVKDGATIGKVAIVRVLPYSECTVNEHVFILRSAKDCLSGFIYHSMRSQGLQELIWQLVTGSAQPGLNSIFIKGVHLSLPPLPEQIAIVRFLDYMDRRIRRYIRAKQKLIKLLEEYKQALIHQAVTGRIDVRTGQPYPAYKDSGVEWLGEVPVHWEIVPLKWLAKCYRNGATPPTTKDFYYIRGTIPWYGPSSFDSGEIVSTPVRFISNTAINDGVARLIHGPALLVVVIGATAGRMTLMEQDGTTNQQITAFELPYDWKTCLFLLRQLRFSESWLRETASTATIPILNTNIVTHLPCLMPPPKERCAIVEYLDAQTAKIDTAIAAARREIELLREYRTRLIADVVTGKLDVREVAARLPEEPSEEDAPWTDEEERAQDETLNGEGDHAAIWVVSNKQ